VRIKELIEKLSKFDENLEVDISGAAWNSCAESIEDVEYNEYKNKVYIY